MGFECEMWAHFSQFIGTFRDSPFQTSVCCGLPLNFTRLCFYLFFFFQDGQDSPDSTEAGDVGECLLPISSTDGSTNPDNYLCEIEKTPFNSVQSWLKHEGTKGEDSSHHSPRLCGLVQLICLPPVRNGGNVRRGYTDKEFTFSSRVLRSEDHFLLHLLDLIHSFRLASVKHHERAASYLQ